MNDTVICMECGQEFKTITPTHVLKKHNMTIEEYRQKHPGAKLVSDNVIVKQNASRDKIYKAKQTPIIEENILTEIEKTNSNFIDDLSSINELVETENNRVIENMEVFEDEIIKFIKSIYPTAISNYMIIIKNFNGSVHYEFITDIAIPEKKLIFDFPNSFFHNGEKHDDIFRDKILPDYGWKIVKFNKRMPTPEDFQEYLDIEKFNKIKETINFSPNTDIIS